MLLFGEVGNLYSWRNAQHGHRAVSGILREEWPPPETGGCGYPKEVAAPNRFSWPRSAEMKRWPRPKYAFPRNHWPLSFGMGGRNRRNTHSSITPEDAGAIIGILKAQGYFDKTPVTVHLSVDDIDNDGYLSYIVKFVVTDANNWFFLAKMQYLMETISKEAFEREVVATVVLCDTFMVPQRIVRSDS
jgi:hypothetical protein